MGVMIIGYFFQPSGSPYIVKGMLNGNAPVTITSSPDDKLGVKIVRSNNQNTGIEFTWSCWLNVASVGTTAKWQNIFNKGNSEYIDATPVYNNNGTGIGIATVNNGPGLYVSNKDNRIVFIMDVVSETGGATNVQHIVIPNIPIGKWFNLCLRLQNKV